MAIFFRQNVATTALAVAFALMLSTAAGASGSRERGIGLGSGSKDESTVLIRGHWTRRGTWVAPYARTTRDASKANNYSALGNENPWTGKIGSLPAGR
jgi:hypothetical protein